MSLIRWPTFRKKNSWTSNVDDDLTANYRQSEVKVKDVIGTFTNWRTMKPRFQHVAYSLAEGYLQTYFFIVAKLAIYTETAI